MKITDFEIGMEFQTCTGQVWRCTDIGTRTILAIEVNPELDSAWLVGPPFVVPEVVFDENAFARAYRSVEEALVESFKENQKRIHPGFPVEILKKIMESSLSEVSRNYPYRQLFRIDRVGKDGEILHPFGAEINNGQYGIHVYRLFESTFEVIPETEFIQYKAAGDKDFQKMKEKIDQRNKQE